MTTLSPSVSIEVALRVVASPRRRTILRHLVGNGNGAVAVDELADCVLDNETSNSDGDLPDHSQITTDLHHSQLPKLADAGLIEYDARTETVRYHPEDRIEQLLCFVTEEI